MSIAIYTHRLSAGGAEAAIIGIANTLHVAGENIVFVVGQAGGELEGLLHPNISVVALNTSRTSSDLWPLIRFLKRNSPKHVIGTLFRCNLVLSFASALAGFSGAVILRETTCVYERTAPRKLKLVMLRAAYIWMSCVATRVIAPAPSILPGLARLSRRYVRLATVVSNPVRAEPYLRAASSLPCSESRRLVAVGRLEAVKAFDLLIDAVASMPELDYRLDIYGDGSHRRLLSRRASSLLPPGRAVFHGFVGDAEAIYSGGGVLVSTSLFEGFPNAVVEALVSGLGVVIVGSLCQFKFLVDAFGLSSRCFVEERNPAALGLRLRDAFINADAYRADPSKVQEYVAGIAEKVLVGYGRI